MIFVTVGTHEQQFNRLVEYMDKWANEHDETVVIQTGYSTYEPKHCQWDKHFPYLKMLEMVDEARVVITHGGPSSFIMPLQIGKTPIVVPRQYKFNEHVNDHQVKFCKEVESRMGTIIVVEDIDKLDGAIENYDEIKKEGNNTSNNAKFCEELEFIVDEMFAGKKQMKKVGILSMQRIANYGSFLQAYGLKHILEDLGCEVQFVDYHPGKTLIPADGGTGIKRKISKVLEAFEYNAPLKEKIKFIKYKKNYAKNYYPYLGISGEMNYAPKLDVLVIGSDEVFNCVQNNTNVGFSPELFGVNNNAKKVITYAASFGNTTVEKLKKYGVKDEVAGYLQKLDAISVRDANSGRIVKELTGKEPVYNLDPVLAFDFIGKCSDIPTDVPEKDYMILYGYAGRFSKEECKKIRAYADSKGLKIYCIGGVQDACDRFIDCNPFQVIAYFQHADCVVTDTFHGTILSVITHRQFASVVRKTGYGNAEKMTDLLGRLGLSDRVVDDLDKVGDIVDEVIDYKKVDEDIKVERERSYKLLRRNVEG